MGLPRSKEIGKSRRNNKIEAGVIGRERKNGWRGGGGGYGEDPAGSQHESYEFLQAESRFALGTMEDARWSCVFSGDHLTKKRKRYHLTQ